MPFRAAPGSDICQSLGAAQTFQRLRQPGTRYHLRPVGALRGGDVPGRHIGPGQQTHGLAKAEAVLLRGALGFAEAVHCLLQLLRSNSIQRPRTSASPSDLASSSPDFGGGRAFPVERDFHLEIEQRVLTDVPTAACPPTVPVTRGRGGRFPRHVAGIRTTTPAASSSGTSRSSCMRFSGRPPQRMEDLTRIDHRLQPRARFRRPLHGKKQ